MHILPLDPELVQRAQHEFTSGLRPQYKPAQSVVQVRFSSPALSEIDAFRYEYFWRSSAQIDGFTSFHAKRSSHLARTSCTDNAVIIVFEMKIKRHPVQGMDGEKRRRSGIPISLKINSSLSFSCPLLGPVVFLCSISAFLICTGDQNVENHKMRRNSLNSNTYFELVHIIEH